MAEQLFLWGDDGEPINLVPTPAEPSPEPPAEPTSLENDLQRLYLTYLCDAAERIATATEATQAERRGEFLRMLNLDVAVGKLTAEQRGHVQRIVWSRG